MGVACVIFWNGKSSLTVIHVHVHLVYRLTEWQVVMHVHLMYRLTEWQDLFCNIMFICITCHYMSLSITCHYTYIYLFSEYP